MLDAAVETLNLETLNLGTLNLGTLNRDDKEQE